MTSPAGTALGQLKVEYTSFPQDSLGQKWTGFLADRKSKARVCTGKGQVWTGLDGSGRVDDDPDHPPVHLVDSFIKIYYS